MIKEGLEESADFVVPLIQHFTRAEELFVNCNGEAMGGNGEAHTYDHEPAFLDLLGDRTNKLVRIGISVKDDDVDSTTSDHWYFVASWDPETMVFIKKTLVARGKDEEKTISILGNSRDEVDLSYEVLENICTSSNVENFPGDENLLFFRTNLMIDQNIDLKKLKYLLKNHVDLMHWLIDMENVEDQAVAPLNAILDQLHGRAYDQSCDLETGEDHGVFLQLTLPKQLLLKSHWVERLGGKEKVNEVDSDNLLANVYHNHESGLIVYE